MFKAICVAFIGSAAAFGTADSSMGDELARLKAIIAQQKMDLTQRDQLIVELGKEKDNGASQGQAATDKATATKLAPDHASAPKPHIVYLLADDLGWNNVGFQAKRHGSANAEELSTPNLDRLATEEGLIMDRFYSFKFCGPSRSALQSGRNPLHVNVINDAISATNPYDRVSGYSGMPVNMTGMGEHMKDAGYRTIFTGKWHVGMATFEQIPRGRGYDENLGYLDGVNNYWNHIMGEDGGFSPPVESDTSVNEGYCINKTTNFQSLWEDSAPAYARANPLSCSQENQMPECIYEDEMFGEYTLERIAEHDVSTPMFLIHSFHIAHNPLELPNEWLEKFPEEDFVNFSQYRRVYTAMVAYMDDWVGKIEQALRDKDMWDNTLVIFSSDNGGPTYRDGEPGANNWPLRGGKRSAFEGGMRTVGFVTGGFLPKKQHGKIADGFIAIEDWLGTFAALAGANPHDFKAEKAGLPPIDSINVWPYLAGEVNESPRGEIIIGSTTQGPGLREGLVYTQGIINREGYKLIVGKVPTWQYQGQFFPNASSPGTYDAKSLDCGDVMAPYTTIGEILATSSEIYTVKPLLGCLYNIFDDPTEHKFLLPSPLSMEDYQEDAKGNTQIMIELRQRMLELDKGALNVIRGIPTGLACQNSKTQWKGFVGPWVEL